MPMMLSLEPLIGRLTAAEGASRNGEPDGGPGTVDKGDTPFHRQIAGSGLAREAADVMSSGIKNLTAFGTRLSI